MRNTEATKAIPASRQASLSEDDKTMIIYFWEEKGNLERWCGWEEKKELIAQELPQVAIAWENYKLARGFLDFVTAKLTRSIQESEESS